MLRPLWKRCLLLAILMVAGMTVAASPADAGWWRWRTGWHGYGYGYGHVYSPGYMYTTSYCSPCVTGYGWSWHYPGWYSGYGRWCGSHVAYYSPWYGSCCGAIYGGCDAVHGGCGAVVVEPEGEVSPSPAEPAGQQPATKEPTSVLPMPPAPKALPAAPDVDLPRLPDMPTLPPAPGDEAKPSARRNLPPGAALLSVVVPQDARVYVNGLLTQTPGEHRQYISYGLQPGYNYTYEVRAEVTRNGQVQSDTQVVQVRVGQTRDLAFKLDAAANEVLAARLP